MIVGEETWVSGLLRCGASAQREEGAVTFQVAFGFGFARLFKARISTCFLLAASGWSRQLQDPVSNPRLRRAMRVWALL